MVLSELVSAEALAKVLGQPRKTIYRWHEEKGLPAYHIGRALVFDQDAVANWLKCQRVGDWPRNGDGADLTTPSALLKGTDPHVESTLKDTDSQTTS